MVSIGAHQASAAARRRRDRRRRCSRCPGRSSRSTRRPAAPSCARAHAADVPPRRRVAAAAEHRERPLDPDPGVDLAARPRCSTDRPARRERRARAGRRRASNVLRRRAPAAPADRLASRRVTSRPRPSVDELERAIDGVAELPGPSRRPRPPASRRAAGAGPGRSGARRRRSTSRAASPGSLTRTMSWIEAGTCVAVHRLPAATGASPRTPAQRVVVRLGPAAHHRGERVPHRRGCPSRRCPPRRRGRPSRPGPRRPAGPRRRRPCRDPACSAATRAPADVGEVLGRDQVLVGGQPHVADVDAAEQPVPVAVVRLALVEVVERRGRARGRRASPRPPRTTGASACGGR